MAGEVFGVAADGGRRGGDELADDAVHGGAAGDFLGGGLLGDPQPEVGLVVLAPLEERPGGIDEQGCPGRYAWEPVIPGDPDHMEHARRLLHVVADRQRWQAALNEARRRFGLRLPPDRSATGEAA